MDLIIKLLKKSTPSDLEIYEGKKLVTLPGHFRTSKQWDLVILYHGKLIAAIELKSLGGPSFGNNFNNRCEEVIGSGVDFRTAQREGAFGSGATPFLGFFIFVHDAEGSRKSPTKPPINPHFPSDPCFEGASYQKRIAILCERLMQEGIYDVASTMSSPPNAGKSGNFNDLSENTTFKRLLIKLSSHVSAESLLL